MQNTTENNNHCMSPYEIDGIIQNGYISVEFSTYNINPANYTYPFKRLFTDENNLLNANSSLEYNFNLFPLTFNSDNGLLFENYENFNGHTYKIDIFNRNTLSDYICSFNFEGGPSATCVSSKLC